jgi:hypothetical protein
MLKNLEMGERETFDITKSQALLPPDDHGWHQPQIGLPGIKGYANEKEDSHPQCKIIVPNTI